MHKLATSLALIAFGAAPLAAQGTLSTQGFGYPTGQLSTQAATMGGGLAETDALSPINPAALAGWLRSGLYFQYSPEYRSVAAGGRSDHTMTTRFPLMEGALTVGQRMVIGLSWSTLLDRTWETQRSGFMRSPSSADSIPFTESFKSAGGISDVRLGVSYQVLRTLWVGVGGHVYTGEDQLGIARVSPDTAFFAPFSQSSTFSFSGTGLSGGLVWQPITALTVGASGRVGGTIKSFRGDTMITRGTIPKRFGAGVALTATPGVIVSARADWEGWSSLAPLGRERAPDEAPLGVTDAWEFGGGVEVRGPSLLGTSLPIRAGFRHRTLPFTVNGTDVRENAYSIGFGIPLSRGRSRIDLGLERAVRNAVPGVEERAWILSAGFMVRP
jgi:hypothetical protein